MASSKEIKKELTIALKEVGEIKPWFDKEVNAWVFEHELYPVEYGGDTPEEVIKNYPLYLKEFIKHRLEDNLSDNTAKKTKGHGGKRLGAGRPKGTIKEPKRRIPVPLDIAEWILVPSHIDEIRRLMLKEKRTA